MKQWKAIFGYEGFYQVSNLGNVKSLNYNHSGISKILKITIDNYGYGIVSLHKGGKQLTRRVHRLVANSFIKNSENKKTVNHKNGIKTDNRVENLEWATYSENMQHAFKTGLKSNTENNNFKKNHPTKGKFGKDNHSSKRLLQYSRKGEFIKEWHSTMDIERELKINSGNISSCCLGNLKSCGGFIWKYI